jgi:hypothetical protein
VPYKIHTVLTHNGIQFRFPPRYADRPTATFMTHMFDMRCRENGIEHRFTKINHPWTNGQVARMNRTIKEATVQRYHYDSHQQLSHHLDDFVRAYNFGRRLNTLKGLTPYEFICKSWSSHLFGTIEQWMNLGAFLMRGPEKAANCMPMKLAEDFVSEMTLSSIGPAGWPGHTASAFPHGLQGIYVHRGRAVECRAVHRPA